MFQALYEQCSCSLRFCDASHCIAGRMKDPSPLIRGRRLGNYSDPSSYPMDGPPWARSRLRFAQHRQIYQPASVSVTSYGSRWRADRSP